MKLSRGVILIEYFNAQFTMVKTSQRTVLSMPCLQSVVVNCMLPATRQCQIRVRFESRVETKFLEPLNQILKLKFLSPWFPCSHSFQKMYNTYMHPDIQKEKNWDNVKKIVISQGNFIKIFTL